MWQGQQPDEHGRHRGLDAREVSAVLVDSSVLLDLVTEDPRWYAWSSQALARCAEDAVLVIVSAQAS